MTIPLPPDPNWSFDSSTATPTSVWLVNIYPQAAAHPSITKIRITFNTVQSWTDALYSDWEWHENPEGGGGGNPSLPTELAVTDLKPQTRYWFTISLGNSDGWSTPTPERFWKEFTMPPSAYVKVGGVWKPAEPWVKKDGYWKPATRWIFNNYWQS